MEDSSLNENYYFQFFGSDKLNLLLSSLFLPLLLLRKSFHRDFKKIPILFFGGYLGLSHAVPSAACPTKIFFKRHITQNLTPRNFVWDMRGTSFSPVKVFPTMQRHFWFSSAVPDKCGTRFCGPFPGGTSL